MKRPIAARDIRKGDLIRFESAFSDAATVATEFRAGGGGNGYHGAGDYFLLDRPEPAVELPTEPTLGWLDGEEGRLLAHWVGSDSVATSDPARDRLLAVAITAFTPATAVPTTALDRMRRVAATCDATYPDYKEAVFAFLAAVDAANGGAA